MSDKQSAFFEVLATAEHARLLLDYDGTLAPFVEQRDRAHPWPGVVERIDALLEDQARGSISDEIIIVTGRSAREIPALLGTKRRPTIWGSHGYVLWRANGNFETAPIAAASTAGLDLAKEWLEKQGWGAQAEAKPAGLAVHWRGLPASTVETIEHRTREAWTPLATAHDLGLHAFDGGLELRCPGRTKGHAVSAILEEVPRGDLALAYLGDDRTDEDAFAAIHEAASRERTMLSLLVRKEPRDSLADERISPPDELLDFLDRWREARRSHE
jgi:trehalose 6-phosphate phosphatase